MDSDRKITIQKMNSTSLENSVNSLHSSTGPSDSIYLSSSSVLDEEPPIHPDSTYDPSSPSGPRHRENGPAFSISDYMETPSERRSPNLPVNSSWNSSEYNEESPQVFSSVSLSNSAQYGSPSQSGHIAQPRFIKSPQTNGSTSSTTSGNNRTESYTANPPSYLAYNQDPYSYEEEAPEHKSFASVQMQTSTGIPPVILTACAYFFGWIGGLIVVLIEKKNVFVLTHAWQSLVAGVIVFVVQFLFMWSKFLYSLIWFLYVAFTFGMIVKVVLDAPSHKVFKLPYIGDWCEHRAYNRIQYHTANGNFYKL